MDKPSTLPSRFRDRLYAAATLVPAVLRWPVTRLVAMSLVPIAFYRAPGRARCLACQWALSLRFPAEDLRGLAPQALAAFTQARAEAFWRDGLLIGLTSGYRDAEQQRRMFTEEVRRTGSVTAARRRVLPPEESSHVRGLALDVRPAEGARWLERHGGRYGLFRVYDNEWWHFEHRTVEPVRLPHPALVYRAGRIHGDESWCCERYEPHPGAGDDGHTSWFVDRAEDLRMRP